MRQALIIDAVRTPRGRGKKDKGALSGIHPQELLAQALNRLADRGGIDKGDVEDVVIGCVSQAHEQGANIARNSVISAGWPDAVTGVTLNRFCGSGCQAVNFAATGIMSGQQEVVIGGGVESMSRCPMGSDEAGIDGNNPILREKVFQVPQGISADLIATLEGFTREDADQFAATSQRRAAAAQEQGFFAKSLFPVRDPSSGEIVLEKDEHPRAGTTAEGLSELRPSFAKLGAMSVNGKSVSGKLVNGRLMNDNGPTLDQIALQRYPEAGAIEHIHTAGNSSGIVDGAAALLLTSDDYAKAHGLRARARIRGLATAGAEPLIMLTAPTPASKKALAKAGMEISDIDLWEINEAFAVVPMQTIRNLKLDGDKVNVNGGSIALGHPLGATGAMLMGTLLDELERRDLSTGLVTLCIGGGMGIATVIERV